LHTLLID
jgi:hypothetical protein